ncbi:Ribulose-phosphate 3-epimerase 1 [Frankia sp. AiPs1]|uniref:ribulose-phosphate 3-epimerase n=1 Tax=Frankia sp. AiPa1 TaxID=573492 RepID=UPI00202B22FE|nr:ribulose-phosphate 3-epimerase [Frankia sp. AiPa1]MCL9762991.1 ribulose-phosphate 3-epimerase [Frankia sp. AiPa1]
MSSADAASSTRPVARLPDGRLLVDVSLWSADLACLGAEIERTAPVADLFHFDVGDSHFVPDLLFFPDLLAALRPLTTVPFHAHLMVHRPALLAALFAQAGADLITVHVETGDDVVPAFDTIRQHGKAAGLALTLDTPISAARPFLDAVDVVVLVGTPIGTRGTGLAPAALDRLRTLRGLLRETGRDRAVKILADGGIRQPTVGPLADAGADGVVAGSLLFGSADLPATIRWLHQHVPPRAMTKRPR